MTKSKLLFATARSGSTPVYILLERYLQKTGGLQGLGEFLNPNCQAVEEENGALILGKFFDRCTPDVDEKSYLNRIKSEHSRRTSRVRMLKNLSTPHFLKVFPDHIQPEHEPWLLNNYDWIFLERRDSFSQLLSFIISFYSGHWYVQGGIKLPKSSILADRWCVKIFENSLWTYHAFKARLQPQHILCFEDFSENLPSNILDKGGMPVDFSLEGLAFTDLQNKKPKEFLIANLEEVKDWYRATFLQQISPI